MIELSNRQGMEWWVDTFLQPAWAPVLVFGLHVLSSRVFDLYALWPPLDVPMHLAGGLAIGFFFHQITARCTGAGLLAAPAWMIAVAVFALTGTAAVLWEFAEFLSDRYLGTHAQGGLQDTLGDMALGIAGGLGYLGTAGAFQRARGAIGGGARLEAE
jgi:hypothetical protein